MSLSADRNSVYTYMPCESLYQGRRLDECAIKCHCEPTFLMSCIVLQKDIETVTITVIKLIVFFVLFYQRCYDTTIDWSGF